MNAYELLSKLLEVNPAVLENEYKERERSVEERIEPPFAMRLDGVGFGSRLAGYRWPRDPRVHEAMVEAAAVLLDKMNAVVAYTASDEINLVILEAAPYAGRLEKLVSISAGLASAVLTRMLGRILYMDSRVIPLQGVRDAERYLLYRARVALNNYVNSLLVARGVRVERMDAGLSERIEMLRKLDVDPLSEPWAAWGTCIQRVIVIRESRGARVERRRVLGVDAPCYNVVSSSKDTR